MAKRRKATKVGVEDLKKVYGLFVDVQRSSSFLREYHDSFLFNEDGKEGADAMDVS